MQPAPDDADALLAALGSDPEAALRTRGGAHAGVLAGDDRVLLFRDALGLEPLYFRLLDDGLAVHSDMLPLARLEDGPSLDEDWLANYLLLLPEEGTRTPYAGVHRVPPGHLVRFEKGGKVDVTRWWTPDLTPIEGSFEEVVREGERLIDEALAAIPAGAPLLLSSGVDSNVLLTRLIEAGRPVDAITASPSSHADPAPGLTSDEYALAHAGGNLVGLTGEHHRLRASPTGLREAIDWGFAAFERPIYNPPNLGWSDGCQAFAASIGAPGVIDGTAGNFTIGHVGDPPLVAAAARRDWSDVAFRLLRSGGRGIRRLLRDAPPHWWAWFLAKGSARKAAKTNLLRPRAKPVGQAIAKAAERGWRPGIEGDGLAFPERRFAEYVEHLDPAPVRRAALRRHGVDVFDPYATPALVEYSLRIPAHHYHDGKEGRRVQRAMLDERLPATIRSGNSGGIQGADWRAAALRDAGLMKTVLDRLHAGHPGSRLFDAKRMRKLLDHWPAHGWEDGEQLVTYRVRLGRAMMGAAFAQWVADLK